MASLTEISKITTRLLLHEPFYGHFLLGMPKAISKTQTKTACVSLFNNQIIKLSVNPDFWESLNETHQYGLIKHEILHVALRHLNMMSDYTNKSVFNIAADLVVNQYIKYTQLPDDAIKLETFASMTSQDSVVELKRSSLYRVNHFLQYTGLLCGKS